MRNKYLVIGSVGLAVLLVAGGSFWFLHNHKAAALNDGAASINTEATDNNSADQSGGLGVTGAGQATNLGQLGGAGQNGTQASPTTGSSNSSSNSANSSQINPSTFAQYDKYASNNSALFGDIQVGTGATLGTNQQASILYKVWLTNGTLVDQSRSDGSGKLQPLAFTLGQHQVIPGMEEGVDGMKVGGTRLIIVPPSVGYGAQGQGSIPPNSVLVFEVQLVDAH